MCPRFVDHKLWSNVFIFITWRCRGIALKQIVESMLNDDFIKGFIDSLYHCTPTLAPPIIAQVAWLPAVRG